MTLLTNWINKRAYLLSCIMLINTVYASNSIVYEITPKNPLLAQVSVDTSTLGSFNLEKPMVFKKPISLLGKIYCDDGDKKTVIRTYDKPLTCKRLTWPITFIRADKHSHNASSQENLYIPNRWSIVFQWNGFPTIKQASHATVCVHLHNEKECTEFPKEQEPPLIFGWGKYHTISLKNFKLKIYPDTDIIASKINTIIPRMEKQYRYLSTLLHNKQISLSLFWLAIDKKLHQYGGSAGKSAFITNYIVNGNQLDNKSLALLLRVSAHESIHILSPYRWPQWINESLAEYYAYKATKLSGMKTDPPILMWRNKKQHLPHRNISLYEAAKQAQKNHDLSYNPLFYLKGAAFWEALDDKLHMVGSSLDQYIDQLTYPDPKHVKLPNMFQKHIRDKIGSAQWKKLEKTYLTS